MQYCGNPDLKYYFLPVTSDVNFASHSEKVRFVPLYTHTWGFHYGETPQLRNMDLNQEQVSVGTTWCHAAIKEAVRIVRVVSEIHRHVHQTFICVYSKRNTQTPTYKLTTYLTYISNGPGEVNPEMTSCGQIHGRGGQMRCTQTPTPRTQQPERDAKHSSLFSATGYRLRMPGALPPISPHASKT